MMKDNQKNEGLFQKGQKKKEEISQEKKSDVPVPEGTKPAEGTKSTPTQPAQRKQKKLPRAFNERKLTGRKKKHERKLNPPHLRKSITPGTVLILLTGRFKGRRVVFLKQLESGLLLVTGPYKLNGIPLRRVNQAYVIATSTKVPLTFKIPKTFDDTYFRKPITKKTKAEDKPKDDFSPQKKKKKHVLPGKVKNVQKKFDAPILAEIKKTPFLKAYLQTRFSLHDKEFPHLLRF